MQYTGRTHEQVLFASFQSPMISGVLGPRRVGKSTLVGHYLANIPASDIVHFNMDKMEQRQQVIAGQLKAMILTQIERQLTPGQRVWVSIDEAQKCPEVFEQVKVLYDQYKDQDAIKFILTGSAVLELHRLSAESLAGRIQLHYLSAFNLAETLELDHGLKVESHVFNLLDTNNKNETDWQQHIDATLPYRDKLLDSLNQQIIWGGLPEVLIAKQEQDKISYLANYLQTYLEKDVRAIESITDLTLYRNLIDICAEQTGSTRDDSKITQALGCHRETLKKYRGYLQSTLIYQDVFPYINSSLKRLVKSPKGYLINNGLISYLQGLYDISLLTTSGMIGHRLENWFLNELQVWLNNTPKRHSIHYWRTSNGVEVDFIVNKPPAVIPFEVTFTSEISAKKVRNILQFMQYEPKATLAIYVYMGEFHWDQKNNIIFLPAWAVV